MKKKTNRNAQGAGSVRQRKDGKWEARYTTGRDPGTGKQIQKSVYGSTQAEVLKKLQAVQVDMERGTFTEPSKITCGAWLDIWVSDYCKHLKPRTRELYEGHISHRLKPALGATKLQKLRPTQIQAFYNGLMCGGDALSPKTIKNLHGLLHKAMQQAVEVGYLCSNPTQGCKLPRIEKKQMQVLDDTQITAFLAAIEGHQFERVYIIDLFTGMRQGEILGLTWDCIDFENGTVYIYRQWQKVDGVFQFAPLKNDKPRTITPAGSVMHLLQHQKHQQTEWQLRAGPAWNNPDKLVFTNELGRFINRDTVYGNLKRIMSAIDMPSMRFHDLRHSYAVASLRAGDDIKVLQENMGHHSVAFSLDQYGHVTEQMKKESAAKMDAFIKTVKGG